MKFANEIFLLLAFCGVPMGIGVVLLRQIPAENRETLVENLKTLERNTHSLEVNTKSLELNTNSLIIIDKRLSEIEKQVNLDSHSDSETEPSDGK